MAANHRLHYFLIMPYELAILLTLNNYYILFVQLGVTDHSVSMCFLRVNAFS